MNPNGRLLNYKLIKDCRFNEKEILNHQEENAMIFEYIDEVLRRHSGRLIVSEDSEEHLVCTFDDVMEHIEQYDFKNEADVFLKRESERTTIFKIMLRTGLFVQESNDYNSVPIDIIVDDVDFHLISNIIIEIGTYKGYTENMLQRGGVKEIAHPLLLKEKGKEKSRLFVIDRTSDQSDDSYYCSINFDLLTPDEEVIFLIQKDQEYENSIPKYRIAKYRTEKIDGILWNFFDDGDEISEWYDIDTYFDLHSQSKLIQRLDELSEISREDRLFYQQFFQ